MIRSCREEPSLFYAADELRSKSLTFYDRLARLPINWELLAKGLQWPFCVNDGRPTDPTLYLKCFFVGHVENIECETDLAVRLADSISIRHFLFGTLAKSPPDHSSLSRVRHAMAEQCDFDTVLIQIVEMLDSYGLVGGQAVAMDTSLVPSRARICVAGEKVSTEKPEAQPSDAKVHAGLIACLSETSPEPSNSTSPELPVLEASHAQKKADQACQEGTASTESLVPVLESSQTAPEEVRSETSAACVEKSNEPESSDLTELEEHFNPFTPKKVQEKRKKLVPSPYDPDAHPAFKPGYKAQPSYKIGIAADYKCRVIVAADAYPASMGEGQTMRLLFTNLAKKWGKIPGKAVTDAGMDDATFHAAIEFFGAIPVTALQKNTSKASGFGKELFFYDQERDVYLCPAGEILKCKSSQDKLRRSYVCPVAVCNECPLKLWCHGSLKGPKQIDRTFDEDSRDRVVAARHNPEHKKLLAKRRVIVEPVYSDFKENDGLAMIWTVGLPCAQMKAKLAAALWNVKILMRHLESKDRAKSNLPTKPTRGKARGAAILSVLIAATTATWRLLLQIAASRYSTLRPLAV